MKRDELTGILDFVRRAEGLKSTLRSTWTRTGRQESAAEHSWRLALLALLLRRQYPDLDEMKLLGMCVVHDLGETINGDIPAPEQGEAKAEEERRDMLDLLRPLAEPQRSDVLALWQEYEDGQTPEAKLVKALDKLETLLQQSQGETPPSFDYAFNLHYGEAWTDLDELIREIRAAVDLETENCLLARRCGRAVK
ncbi:MAG: HD domain-containing protein [Desulfovibrio sp.]|nr:HD domain-containing protein [Desulfovibrio sp.]